MLNLIELLLTLGLENGIPHPKISLVVLVKSNLSFLHSSPYQSTFKEPPNKVSLLSFLTSVEPLSLIFSCLSSFS